MIKIGDSIKVIWNAGKYKGQTHFGNITNIYSACKICSTKKTYRIVFQSNESNHRETAIEGQDEIYLIQNNEEIPVHS